MLNVSRKKYPISATLKNGKIILIHNPYEAHLLGSNILEGYHFEDNIITISKKGLSEVNLNLGNNNGDVLGIFFKNEYDFLDVKNKIVLDIGANIADSSIYFVLKGAKNVIAVEPFPKNNALAEKNIQMNNLSEKIFIEKSGCAHKKGTITLDEHSEGAGFFSTSTTDGMEIPLMTVSDLIKKYQIPDDSVMKMDCEGCEIDILLNIDRETIRKFSHIQVEYHYGYQNLKQKLESFGFEVQVSTPCFLKNPQANKSMCLGFLYARKLNE